MSDERVGGRMKLTVVGCSGSFPGPDSPASCYLVEAPYEGRPFRLLLDLGSGAIGALQRYTDLREVDAVALSHLHPDHCLDLCGYYVVRKYHPGGPLPRLRVYGPEGTAARMARAYELDEQVGMTGEFDFVTYPVGPFDVGPFTLAVAQVDHPAPAFAIKVTHDGRSLVYTGDTGPCPQLDAFAGECDLLLAEASFVEGVVNPEHLHLTGSQAAQLASRIGVQRLVLTHIPPWYSPQVAYAEARQQFDGELSLAEPGATYEI
jgi:ribonuclease BN (tRNA processing enzyme)